MNENVMALSEGDIQAALLEISSKKITDMTSQILLLEANLLACQNKLRAQIESSRDVLTELNTYKDDNTEKYDTMTKQIEKLKSELAGERSKVELSEQEITDLKIKIDSGYKAQIRDLKNQLEVFNGNDNTPQKKSNK
tara:strand:+ start:4967 stop:5380 length:414 start_codon:yes stop_codon:yes gene_type:complete